MGLLRTIFWVALFLASTFAFTVLFEYGTTNYAANAQLQWTSLVKFYHETTEGKKPTGAK